MIQQWSQNNSGRFSPTKISSLALWLDAADAATITLDGSNNVSQWNDKSGNGRHAAQGTTLNRPGYLTNQLNGLAAVRPSTVSKWLDIAGFPSLAGGYSVFAVVQSPGSADAGIISLNAGVASSALVVATSSSSLVFNSQWGDSVNQAVPANNTNFAFWTHYDGAHNTGNFSMRLSTQSSTAAKTMTQLAGTPPSGTMSLMTYNGANWWTRNIYEILIYDRITTVAEDDALKAYITAKWGLVWS